MHPLSQVICNDKGRGHGHFPSWGRRRRAAGTDEHEDESLMAAESAAAGQAGAVQPEEDVHELLRVYMSRDEVPLETKQQQQEQSVSSEHKMPLAAEPQVVTDRVCVSQAAYYALLSAVTVLVAVIVVVGVAGGKLLRSTRSNNKHLVY